jgi:hypothetical protein
MIAALLLPDPVRLAVQVEEPKSRLEAENAALRHQLIVLQRRVVVASSSRMGIACSWMPDLCSGIESGRPVSSHP